MCHSFAYSRSFEDAPVVDRFGYAKAVSFLCPAAECHVALHRSLWFLYFVSKASMLARDVLSSILPSRFLAPCPSSSPSSRCPIVCLSRCPCGCVRLRPASARRRGARGAGVRLLLPVKTPAFIFCATKAAIKGLSAETVRIFSAVFVPSAVSLLMLTLMLMPSMRVFLCGGVVVVAGGGGIRAHADSSSDIRGDGGHRFSPGPRKRRKWARVMRGEIQSAGGILLHPVADCF